MNLFTHPPRPLSADCTFILELRVTDNHVDARKDQVLACAAAFRMEGEALWDDLLPELMTKLRDDLNHLPRPLSAYD